MAAEPKNARVKRVNTKNTNVKHINANSANVKHVIEKPEKLAKIEEPLSQKTTNATDAIPQRFRQTR